MTRFCLLFLSLVLFVRIKTAVSGVRTASDTQVPAVRCYGLSTVQPPNQPNPKPNLSLAHSSEDRVALSMEAFVSRLSSSQ